MPASSKRRIVLRPCARNSRARGAAGTTLRARSRRPRSPLRPDVYASLMGNVLPATIVEAARRFGERTAYVTEAGGNISYADIDRVSDEIAMGLTERGVNAGDVVAL